MVKLLGLKISYLVFLIFICVLMRTARADDYLQLLTTISFPRDSSNIAVSSITNVGDFDADGWDDMAVGLRASGRLPFDDKVYLYRGGPSFDTVPDLIFIGDPDNPDLCSPSEYQTGFGFIVTALGDFNGDTFEDMAISAFGLCAQDFQQGRIYIYLGGPNPDTIADLTVTGTVWHNMGYSMAGGDFNGDGLGDLLAVDGDYFIGSFHVYFFEGSNPPDLIPDKLYYPDSRISLISGGFDIDADSYDDFVWDMWDGTLPNSLYLGNDTLPDFPVFTGENAIFPPFDISGDSVDDFFLWQDGIAYLCLGGNPLDFEADYPAGSACRGSLFLYHRAGMPNLLMSGKPDWRWPDLRAYHTGLPFDTIPCATFDYGFEAAGQWNIGDINADEIDEIVVRLPLDTTVQHINIYGIVATAVADDSNYGPPDRALLLQCYPNPFNNAVSISFFGPVENGEEIRVEIYNIRGQEIKELNIKGRKGREATVSWEAKDRNDREIPSGIYILRATTLQGHAYTKLIYLK
jgi:hypothetical protein